MNQQDVRLAAAIKRIKEATEKLQPSDKLKGMCKQKAKEKMYATKESAATANNCLSLEREAKAFMVISGAVEQMAEEKPISGKFLYIVLRNEVNLFPADAGVEEQKRLFMASALNSMDAGGSFDDFEASVKSLWDLMQPIAEAYVEHAAVVNELIASEFELELRKKETKHVKS